MATTTNTVQQQNEMLAKLKSATSKAEFDQYLKEASDLKISIPTSSVNAARVALTKQLSGKYQAELSKVTTQQQLDDIQARAKSDGITPNLGYVEQAQKSIVRTTAAAAAAEKAAAEKAAADKVAAEKAAVAAEKAAAEKAAAAERDAAAVAAREQAVADAKAKLQAQTEAAANAAAAEKAAVAAEKAAAEKAAAAAKLGEKYNQELNQATTQQQLDDIKSRAAAESATLNQGYVDRSQSNITSKQTAAEKAVAEQQQAAAQQQQVKLQQDLQNNITSLQNAGELTTEKLNNILSDYNNKISQTALTAATAPTTPVAPTASPEGYPYSFSNELGEVRSQQDLDTIIAKAEAEGKILDPTYVSKAKLSIQSGAATEAEADRLHAIRVANDPTVNPNRSEYEAEQATRLNALLPKSDGTGPVAPTAPAASTDINQLIADLTARGIPKSIIDNAVKTAKANDDATAQQKWVDQVLSAATPQAAQDLISQAKAAGQWNINDAATSNLINTVQGKVDAAAEQQRIQQQQAAYEQRVKDQAAATQAAAAEFAAGLPTPTSFVNKFTPDGMELQGRPDNPATPENEAGWYVPGANGLQKIGSDGKAVGPVIPDYDAFNQLAETQKRETQAYNLQQEEETRALAAATLATNVKDFESALPTPDAFISSGAQSNILRGPDGSTYQLQPGNRSTGAPAQWIKTDSGMLGVTNVATGTTVSNQEYNEQYNQIQADNQKASLAERAALIEQQREDREFGLDDFGKVLAIVALSAVIGPMIQGAISGAAATEAAGAAASMAEAGYSSAEIASMLESTYGLEAAAAAEAAGTATGIATGAVDAATVAASSISPEAIAMANATADPIAALSAAQGWTTADIGYLTSIGASPELISLAEANNVAAGFRPDGLYELTAEETALMESGIDPDLINRFQPPQTGGLQSGAIVQDPEAVGAVWDATRGVYVDPVNGGYWSGGANGFEFVSTGTPGTGVAVEGATGLGGGAGSGLGTSTTGSTGLSSGTAAGTTAGSATSAINPATGLLETVIPGVGTNPVASVVLSAPEIAAAAVPSISPGVLAGLAGGAAILGGLAGGGGGAAAGGSAAGTGGTGAAPAPTTPVQPAPTTPTTPTPTAPVQPAPTTPTGVEGGTAGGTPSVPTTTVPTTPAPAAPGGTTVYNPGTGLYETTIPAGPGGVAEVIVSPTPPVAPPVVTPPPTIPPVVPGTVAAGGVAAGTAGGTTAGTGTTAGGVTGGTPGGVGTTPSVPNIPTTTVPTTTPPATGGTTVYNPGTGLYETTIPAGPGGVAEVVLSPVPPAGAGTGVALALPSHFYIRRRCWSLYFAL
jgi:hypothetical protein